MNTVVKTNQTNKEFTMAMPSRIHVIPKCRFDLTKSRVVHLYNLTLRTTELYAKKQVPTEYTDTLWEYLRFKTKPIDKVVGNWTIMAREVEAVKDNPLACTIIGELCDARLHTCTLCNILLFALFCGYYREFGQNNIPQWNKYEDIYEHVHMNTIDHISAHIPDELYDELSTHLSDICECD